jgi:hypothetical protein
VGTVLPCHDRLWLTDQEPRDRIPIITFSHENKQFEIANKINKTKATILKKSLFGKILWILIVGAIYYFSGLPLLYLINYSHNNRVADPIKLMSEACEQRNLCPQYKIFRNECALAVDFERCLRIKTDGGIKTLACNNDGTSQLIKEINPNAFFCLGTAQATQLISSFIKQ